MVSLGWSLRATPDYYVLDHTPSTTPRVSFSSSEFLDESNFITICPNPEKYDQGISKVVEPTPDFEFRISSSLSSTDEMLREGKLLPLPRQTQGAGKKPTSTERDEKLGGPHHQEKPRVIEKEVSGTSWFLDEDPSPRPPRCTVLWKELLRLKKQRGGRSTSFSSSSSSSSSADLSVLSGGEKREGGARTIEASNKLVESSSSSDHNERRRGGRIRIRHVIHVPICNNTISLSSTPTRKGRSAR